MSDFITPFWALYVGGIVVFGILFCVAVLLIGATARAHTAEDNTTGHVWDGDLAEINNPLPKWWVGLFWITIIFSIAYYVLYPGFGSYQGTLNWSSQGQYETEVAKGDKEVSKLLAQFEGMSIEDMAKNPQAHAIGKSLFLNNCAQCHSSDARGGVGYPNLTDSDWLWGGSPEQIQTTITKGRQGMMPPMIDAIGGTPDDAKAVAHYVLSLSDMPHDPALAATGKGKFVACAACHGADGKGTHALGAPNLTSAKSGSWLMGVATEAKIVQQITHGKSHTMPAWETRFSPDQIRLLTAYVWGLSSK